jgi:hypothetical protein
MSQVRASIGSAFDNRLSREISSSRGEPAWSLDACLVDGDID